MAIISTLRPLSQGLLERLWWLLSGYVLTPIEYPMTLDALNDDCLLLLLDTLSMPQLFQLRGVSHRFSHLIEQYSLRKFRTLIFCYVEKKETTNTELSGGKPLKLHFASRQDAIREFGTKAVFLLPKEGIFPAGKLFPLRSSALPLSLPCLLPRLSCLTLEHYLVDQVQAPTEKRLAVNRLLVPYINSNWSTTLTTLHLYIYGSPKPQPDYYSFSQLNRMTSLQHLFLEFSRFTEPERLPFLLPDIMPVFGQLLSFSISFYNGSNTVTLLHQLGHHLSFLLLHTVTCLEDDFLAFLRARPNYAQTLKFFYVSLSNMSWKLFTVATQSLSSLEQIQFCYNKAPGSELASILTDLSHLKNLKNIHWVPLSVDQLRALHLRQYLPRLTSISKATIFIYNFGENENTFQTSELFDNLLPYLSRVFCSLENIVIRFAQSRLQRRDEALSQQLSTKVRQLFPAIKSVTANYLV